MEVKISRTSLILPSVPPFTQPHTLPLSHLDTDPNLDIPFRYLRVYRTDSTESRPCPPSPATGPFTTISAALSAALVHYYPLAATLCLPPAGSPRFELFCSQGQGVPLIQASADCTLESVQYLDGAVHEPDFVENLAPYPSKEEMRTNPCMLQVTVFECGGFVLGAAIHHSMFDGLGATRFFGAMAELARGVEHVSVHPVWDRATLLGPRDPPRVVAPIGEYLNRVTGGFEPYREQSGKVVVREVVHVDNKCMERFKGWLLEKCGDSFTTFEALGAFIWKAKVQTSIISRDDKVTFAYSTNIRRIVTPAVPTGYWGNGCVPIYIHMRAADFVERPIWETTLLIKKSKANVTDEYVRSFIDFQKINCGAGISAGDHVSGFTDWRHLGHSSVDFGWGGPVTVLPLSRKLLGSLEPCFFLPYSSATKGKKKNDFKVLVNLPESSVAGFRKVMEKFSNQDFDLDFSMYQPNSSPIGSTRL